MGGGWTDAVVAARGLMNSGLAPCCKVGRGCLGSPVGPLEKRLGVEIAAPGAEARRPRMAEHLRPVRAVPLPVFDGP